MGKVLRIDVKQAYRRRSQTLSAKSTVVGLRLFFFMQPNTRYLAFFRADFLCEIWL